MKPMESLEMVHGFPFFGDLDKGAFLSICFGDSSIFHG